MLTRAITPLLAQRLASFPAVALLGPRQSGKTTVARSLEGRYYDLEQEPDRLRLDLDWNDVVSADELVIFDEAQSEPELFPRLRGAIDQERHRNGRFLLLGSIAPALMQQVSEALTGRLALLELTPLLHEELQTQASRNRHWLCGGFPDGGVLRPSSYPVWQQSFISLLCQRDLPNWGLSAPPATSSRLMRMLSATNGQIWNASEIGKSLDLSYHTVNSYLDYFEGAYLLRRLPPFRTNIKKRLIKRPKLYWRDTGLLHSLQLVPHRRALLSQPWVGASWEAFVIEQVVGHLLSLGIPHQTSFFRTSDGKELDLVLELSNQLWAIEIKLTSAPNQHHLRQLNTAADLIRATHRVLVSQTNQPTSGDQVASTNLLGLLQRLASLA